MAFPQLRCTDYKVLDDDQMYQVHLAVLRVLEEVGVFIEHEQALKIFADCGCKVDFDKRRVCIPEYVLNEALSSAPSRFTFYGLKPEFDVLVDTTSIYTIGGSSALFVIDLDGNRRSATMQDLEDLTRLQDALPNLHIMHGIVNPQDIPQEAFDRRLFPAVMKNTARNYYSQGTGGDSVKDQIDQAAVILGSTEAVKQRPPFTIVLCMTSPLEQARLRVEELLACAENDIPIYVEVDSQPGATTPITLAGTLVEECANVLCGITLAQLIRPGLPCVFAIASGILDMATTTYSGADPRANLLHVATAQMARYYNLPFQGGTGIDAVISDVQAGYERGMQVLANALGGTNFIHLSIGLMEQMLTASYEQCVIDNEILDAAFVMARGMEVNDETLAVDVLKDVGPGGNFLSHEHTVKHFRNLCWFPKITVRDKYQTWQATGAKDMRQRANEMARKILAEHHPTYIDEKTKVELEKLAVAQQNAVIKKTKKGKT
ncbi:MAG: trimethylamine methyltransferase family protein [Planctomycetota bacterium]|nr:MAG: trimethylamine methyltransferase family protein [Planctomycetota bacterium]